MHARVELYFEIPNLANEVPYLNRRYVKNSKLANLIYASHVSMSRLCACEITKCPFMLHSLLTIAFSHKHLKQQCNVLSITNTQPKCTRRRLFSTSKRKRVCMATSRTGMQTELIEKIVNSKKLQKKTA